MAHSTLTRFHSKYTKDPYGCWLWNTTKDRGWYGQFWFEGRRLGAHRVSYILFKGPIPDGYFVCHSCDVPACCNPDHLFLGTHQENMRDMRLKKRAHKSRFTDAEIDFICHSPLPQTELGKMLGVSQQMISLIRNKKREQTV